MVREERRPVSTIWISLTVSAILFLSATSSWAASAGGQAEHAFTWRDWFWPVVNFAILLTVLIFFGRKPIRGYFQKRTELIEKSLKEAQEAKNLAEKTLAEVRSRLQNTDAEVEAIVRSARKTGEKEKEALIAEGERLKEKIIEQARSHIDFELQKAREKIKSEAALMALDLAEKQLKEQLGEKQQQALIDEYIRKLEVRQ